MTDFSYQLYSSRNFGPLTETLRMVADAGYVAVEGYGALLNDLDAVRGLRQALRDTGLHMRSCHVGLDQLRGQPDQILNIIDALDIQQVFCPFLMPDDRPTDAAGWAAFGQDLATVAAPYLRHGTTFGWHNHDFEFTPLADGTLPIDAMLADNELAFEFDVAWAFVAGHDPADTIARYGDRIVAAHVKDRAPADKTAEDGWADLGDGLVPWDRLLPALSAAGCTNFVMEHDNPSDDARFARASIAHGKTL